MMSLREYRSGASRLADFLPWAALVAPGIVLNKDGSFQRTARFRGPDLDSATPAELVAVTARLNAALRRLGSGWAIFVEAARDPARGYPDDAFPDPASALVERGKEYVQSARLIRVSPLRIMLTHILPNTLTPVMVTATLNLGLAILIEATLSFLGVGMPPTEPSLGTLIRLGNQFLFSGQWWVVVFPAVYLSLVVLVVNLLGDWLRDALNPRLR